METSLSSQQPLEEAETQALKLLNREEVKGEGLAWEGVGGPDSWLRPLLCLHRRQGRM